ncbi:hypothetical protein GCM10009724_08290 [Microbacterium lacticum]|nr:hypothetical protein GCM10009724_08290 [Microbacterium lacticum]
MVLPRAIACIAFGLVDLRLNVEAPDAAAMETVRDTVLRIVREG